VLCLGERDIFEVGAEKVGVESGHSREVIIRGEQSILGRS
jgi:hypothetical protein